MYTVCSNTNGYYFLSLSCFPCTYLVFFFKYVAWIDFLAQHKEKYVHDSKSLNNSYKGMAYRQGRLSTKEAVFSSAYTLKFCANVRDEWF